MYNITSIVFTAALILAANACTPPVSPEEDEDSPLEHESELIFSQIKDEDVEIITIDGCEYIVYQHNVPGSNHGYGFMSHKGNCKNPVHIYNKLPESAPPDTTLKKEDRK